MRSRVIALVGITLFGGCERDPGLRNLPAPDQNPVGVFQPTDGELVLVDRETGSTFNVMGEAIAGPLAGSGFRLTQVPTVNMFWSAFRSFFPDAPIWSIDDLPAAPPLAQDKTGISSCSGGIDCIPSLPHIGPPSGALSWTRVGAPDAQYLNDNDMVVATLIHGKPRAYPYRIMAWHEIANDSVDEVRYVVSLCPLTGSAVVWGNNGDIQSLGVSGNLLRQNLVMFDHATKSLWPQLWMGAVSGEKAGTWLNPLPSVETTWGRWRRMYPETLVLSDDTGYEFPYDQRPFRVYDGLPTIGSTEPISHLLYPSAAMVLGLVDRPSGAAQGYVYIDLARELGNRAVLNDRFDDAPVVIVFDEATQLALAYYAQDPEGSSLTFDAADFTP